MSIVRNSLTLILCVSLVAVLAADDTKTSEKPKSAAAVTALKEYEKSMHDAEEAFHKTQVAAEHKLMDKLKIAMSIATKAGNLSEANAIDAQIQAATARIDAAKAVASAAGPVRITGRWTVRFNNGNVRTYVFLPNGDVNFVESKFVAPAHPDGDSWILDFGDGKIERLTAVDAKLHIDHFEPSSTFPNGPPKLTATAVQLPEK